jgi:hypothetical protein
MGQDSVLNRRLLAHFTYFLGFYAQAVCCCIFPTSVLSGRHGSGWRSDSVRQMA